MRRSLWTPPRSRKLGAGGRVAGPQVRGSTGPQVRGPQVRGPQVRGPQVRGPLVRGPVVTLRSFADPAQLAGVGRTAYGTRDRTGLRTSRLADERPSGLAEKE